jgi:hypothetical protein
MDADVKKPLKMQGAQKTSDKKRDTPKMQGTQKTSDEKRGTHKNTRCSKDL